VVSVILLSILIDLVVVDGALLLVDGAVLRKNIIAWDVVPADRKNTGTRLEARVDCMINWQSLDLADLAVRLGRQ